MSISNISLSSRTIPRNESHTCSHFCKIFTCSWDLIQITCEFRVRAGNYNWIRYACCTTKENVPTLVPEWLGCMFYIFISNRKFQRIYITGGFVIVCLLCDLWFWTVSNVRIIAVVIETKCWNSTIPNFKNVCISNTIEEIEWDWVKHQTLAVWSDGLAWKVYRDSCCWYFDRIDCVTDEFTCCRFWREAIKNDDDLSAVFILGVPEFFRTQRVFDLVHVDILVGKVGHFAKVIVLDALEGFIILERGRVVNSATARYSALDFVWAWDRTSAYFPVCAFRIINITWITLTYHFFWKVNCTLYEGRTRELLLWINTVFFCARNISITRASSVGISLFDLDVGTNNVSIEWEEMFS